MLINAFPAPKTIHREGAKARRRNGTDAFLLRAFAPSRLIILFFFFAVTRSAVAATEPRMPTYETKYYTLCTDVDRGFADDLARRLDLMYEEYARRLVEFVPASGAPKFKVYVFGRKDDYMNFCDGRAPNSCGVTIPGRNVVAAFTEGESRESVRKTLQHEAFHQFAFTAIGPKLPIWLNEGLAQVFEEGLFTGQQFLLGQVTTERVTQLNEEVRSRRLMPFNDILNMTDGAWHDNMNDKAKAATQYTQAWAMTHFLIFAADESGNFRFRARLIDMLRLIHADRDGGDAFAATFGDNLAGFQRRFVEYAGTMRTSPEALCIERQDALADFLAIFHQDGRRFADVIDFRKTLTGGGY